MSALRPPRAIVEAVAAAGIVLAVILVLRPLTPHVSFNGGLGYDGVAYADMVAALRGASDGALIATRPHFAYRPLAPAIVAASGLDPIRGFLLVNLTSFVLSGPLLLALLRRYGVGVAPALLGVLWWATLPAGVRYAIYDPVLTDGLGLLFLLAALVAIAHERVAVFALILAFGVLVRENLVVLVPFAALALWRRGPLRAVALAALAAVPAALVFVAVRLAPPLPPPHGFDALFEIRQNWDWLTRNASDRAWRLLAAGPLSLGLVFAIPIARANASARFLRDHVAWAYYFVGTLLVIIAGGADWDRYFLYFAPALLVLTFAICLPALGVARATIVTLAQLVAVRFAWPVGPNEAEYLAYNVATMEMSHLAALAVVSLGAIAFAVLVTSWPARRRALAPSY